MKYQLDFPENSDTAYLTNHLDAISTSTIENWSSFLVEHIGELLDVGSDLEPRHRPSFYAVRLVLDGKYTIPERVFWSLVIRIVDDPEQHIAAYIDRLCEVTTAEDTSESVASFGRSELAWSDHEHPIGSYPLMEFLDWRYEDHGRFRRSPIGDIFDPFLKFLEHCDMDHETWQDDYINRVLSKYEHTESEEELDRLLTLLHFRLFDGQSILIAAEKDFNYLHKFLCYKGGLKKVLDRILSDDELDEYMVLEEDIYLKLCACVYGNDQVLTGEVMDYVKQRFDDELLKMNQFDVERIEAIRTEADAYLKNRFTVNELYRDEPDSPHCPNNLDSGFHQYVIKDQKWYRTDA